MVDGEDGDGEMPTVRRGGGPSKDGGGVSRLGWMCCCCCRAMPRLVQSFSTRLDRGRRFPHR